MSYRSDQRMPSVLASLLDTVAFIQDTSVVFLTVYGRDALASRYATWPNVRLSGIKMMQTLWTAQLFCRSKFVLGRIYTTKKKLL